MSALPPLNASPPWSLLPSKRCVRGCVKNWNSRAQTVSWETMSQDGQTELMTAPPPSAQGAGMTDQQPEALRLADEMENYWNERGPDAEAVAVELRRLHEENRHLRDRTNELGEISRELIARIAALEKALGMAVEALMLWEDCFTDPDAKPGLRFDMYGAKALATARQTLGGAA